MGHNRADLWLSRATLNVEMNSISIEMLEKLDSKGREK
jgi:hypothetical protein